MISEMGWNRLLPLLRCPSCRAPLAIDGQALQCAANHRIPLTADGLPAFGPVASAGPGPADCSLRARLRLHAALNDYAYLTIARGHAEGFYRTISDLLSRVLDWNRDLTLLNWGCGLGRCAADLSEFFPRATVAAAADDATTLSVAAELLLGEGTPILVDLHGAGFGSVTFYRRRLPNLFLVQAALPAQPFATVAEGGGFDAVVCIAATVPAHDCDPTIQALAATIKPGGWFLIVAPRRLPVLRSAVEHRSFSIEVAMDGLIRRELLANPDTLLERRTAVVLARRLG